MFSKAERKKAKLRLGICGTSGSGKTYSALLLAKGLGGKIAVVDTENHSAELYAGQKDMPNYDVCILTPPYDTEKYIKAIEEAEKAGYDVVILDSISHAWAGDGGLLDQKGKIDEYGKGNSYTSWRSITPKHNKFIEKMLSCNLHLIATMRSKTEYALVTNDKGKQEPKKMGLAPIQREGMDYEFTVVFEIDSNHNSVATKDRTSLFDGKIFTPSTKTGVALLEWLDTGIKIEEPPKDDIPASLGEETPPPEQPKENIVFATLKEVSHRTGTSKDVTHKDGTVTKGQPWKLYLVKTETGDEYGTFSDTVVDLANTFISNKELAKIEFSMTSRGNKMIESITA
jgi:hypothetical protein